MGFKEIYKIIRLETFACYSQEEGKLPNQRVGQRVLETSNVENNISKQKVFNLSGDKHTNATSHEIDDKTSKLILHTRKPSRSDEL